MDCESNKHNESETQDELFDYGGPWEIGFYMCMSESQLEKCMAHERW